MTQRRDNNRASRWQVKDKNLFAFMGDTVVFCTVKTAATPLPNKRVK